MDIITLVLLWLVSLLLAGLLFVRLETWRQYAAPLAVLMAALILTQSVAPPMEGSDLDELEIELPNVVLEENATPESLDGQGGLVFIAEPPTWLIQAVVVVPEGTELVIDDMMVVFGPGSRIEVSGSLRVHRSQLLANGSASIEVAGFASFDRIRAGGITINLAGGEVETTASEFVRCEVMGAGSALLDETSMESSWTFEGELEMTRSHVSGAFDFSGPTNLVQSRLTCDPCTIEADLTAVNTTISGLVEFMDSAVRMDGGRLDGSNDFLGSNVQFSAVNSRGIVTLDDSEAVLNESSFEQVVLVDGRASFGQTTLGILEALDSNISIRGGTASEVALRRSQMMMEDSRPAENLSMDSSRVHLIETPEPYSVELVGESELTVARRMVLPDWIDLRERGGDEVLEENGTFIVNITRRSAYSNERTTPHLITSSSGNRVWVDLSHLDSLAMIRGPDSDGDGINDENETSAYLDLRTLDETVPLPRAHRSGALELNGSLSFDLFPPNEDFRWVTFRAGSLNGSWLNGTVANRPFMFPLSRDLRPFSVLMPDVDPVPITVEGDLVLGSISMAAVPGVTDPLGPDTDGDDLDDGIELPGAGFMEAEHHLHPFNRGVVASTEARGGWVTLGREDSMVKDHFWLVRIDEVPAESRVVLRGEGQFRIQGCDREIWINSVQMDWTSPSQIMKCGAGFTITSLGPSILDAIGFLPADSVQVLEPGTNSFELPASLSAEIDVEVGTIGTDLGHARDLDGHHGGIVWKDLTGSIWLNGEVIGSGTRPQIVGDRVAWVENNGITVWNEDWFQGSANFALSESGVLWEHSGSLRFRAHGENDTNLPGTGFSHLALDGLLAAVVHQGRVGLMAIDPGAIREGWMLGQIPITYLQDLSSGAHALQITNGHIGWQNANGTITIFDLANWAGESFPGHALSLSGSQISFSHDSQVWLRDLSRSEAVSIAAEDASATSLTDSQVAYIADGKLKTREGSVAVVVSDGMQHRTGLLAGHTTLLLGEIEDGTITVEGATVHEVRRETFALTDPLVADHDLDGAADGSELRALIVADQTELEDATAFDPFVHPQRESWNEDPFAGNRITPFTQNGVILESARFGAADDGSSVTVPLSLEAGPTLIAIHSGPARLDHGPRISEVGREAPAAEMDLVLSGSSLGLEIDHHVLANEIKELVHLEITTADPMEITTEVQLQVERVRWIDGEIHVTAQLDLEASLTPIRPQAIEIRIRLDPPQSTSLVSMIELAALDSVLVLTRGRDVTSRDTDDDGVLDGPDFHPLSSDMDRDGLEDSAEIALGTNPGRRDSDGDGLRDGVELGSIDGGASSGSWMERTARWGTPYRFTQISNSDADPSTVTDPLQTDTDRDGLPDGGQDGWAYLAGGRDPIHERSFHQRPLSRTFRYDSAAWKMGNLVDGKLGPAEGEDLDLDGSSTALDPTRDDSDDDGMPDGYEVHHGIDLPDGDLDMGLEVVETNDGWTFMNADGVVVPVAAPSRWIGLYLTEPVIRVTSTSVMIELWAIGLADLRIASSARPMFVREDGLALFDLGDYDVPPWGAVELRIISPEGAMVRGDGSLARVLTLQNVSGGDGLTNYEEWLVGTDPSRADTDAFEGLRKGSFDGMNDGAEVSGMVPLALASGSTFTASNWDSSDATFQLGNRNFVHDGTHPRDTQATPFARLEDGTSLAMALDASALWVGEEIRFVADGTSEIPGIDGSNRDRVLFSSSPFDADSDGDGILDGNEPPGDLDGDGIDSIRDPDSDNDDLRDGDDPDPTDSDIDDDGLPDGHELQPFEDTDHDGSVNILDIDSDDDGLADGHIEGMVIIDSQLVPYDPFLHDYGPSSLDHDWWEGEDRDRDGFIGPGESSPLLRDTDQDGLLDGPGQGISPGEGFRLIERPFQSAPTNPTMKDTDGDGLWDRQEILGHEITINSMIVWTYSDPALRDGDGDGLDDRKEWDLGLDATQRDSDGDCILDGIENRTDPRQSDTDGDGLFDGFEDLDGDGIMEIYLGEAGENPDCDGEDHPEYSDALDGDSDNDGISDYWEFYFLANHRENPFHDSNQDGVIDLRSRDSDGDGLADGDENFRIDIYLHPDELDPTEPDSDGDGLGDEMEVWPFSDSDGDGLVNGRDPDSNNDGIGDRDQLVVTFRTSSQTYSESTTIDLPRYIDQEITDPDYEMARYVVRFDGEPEDPTILQTLSNGAPRAVTDLNGNSILIDSDRWINDSGNWIRLVHIPGTADPTPLRGQLVVVDERAMLDPDSDDDGLSNIEDRFPLDRDADDDGIMDGTEIDLHMDPHNNDTDFDGLTDTFEMGIREPVTAWAGISATDLTQFQPAPENSTPTSPRVADTDRDSVPDGTEDLNRNGLRDPTETDPTDPDTDHDGLDDFGDLAPLNPDRDNDGLLDGREIITDPDTADTDGDGLDDGIEDRNRNSQRDPGETNPAEQDSDADGLSDGIEIEGGTDPLLRDSDGDGLEDATEDANGNGRVDGFETDPANPDTDGDGAPDGAEIRGWQVVVRHRYTEYERHSIGPVTSNPWDPDTDNDGLRDGDELLLGADPTLTDTDLDGLNDNVDPLPDLIELPAPKILDVSWPSISIDWDEKEFEVRLDPEISNDERVSWAEARLYRLLFFEVDRDRFEGDDDIVFEVSPLEICTLKCLLLTYHMEITIQDVYGQDDRGQFGPIAWEVLRRVADEAGELFDRGLQWLVAQATRQLEIFFEYISPLLINPVTEAILDFFVCLFEPTECNQALLDSISDSTEPELAPLRAIVRLVPTLQTFVTVFQLVLPRIQQAAEILPNAAIRILSRMFQDSSPATALNSFLHPLPRLYDGAEWFSSDEAAEASEASSQMKADAILANNTITNNALSWQTLQIQMEPLNWLTIVFEVISQVQAFASLFSPMVVVQLGLSMMSQVTVPVSFDAPDAATAYNGLVPILATSLGLLHSYYPEGKDTEFSVTDVREVEMRSGSSGFDNSSDTALSGVGGHLAMSTSFLAFFGKLFQIESLLTPERIGIMLGVVAIVVCFSRAGSESADDVNGDGVREVKAKMARLGVALLLYSVIAGVITGLDFPLLIGLIATAGMILLLVASLGGIFLDVIANILDAIGRGNPLARGIYSVANCRERLESLSNLIPAKARASAVPALSWTLLGGTFIALGALANDPWR